MAVYRPGRLTVVHYLGVPDVDVAVKVAEVGCGERPAAAALRLMVVRAGLMDRRHRGRGGHLKELNFMGVQWCTV